MKKEVQMIEEPEKIKYHRLYVGNGCISCFFNFKTLDELMPYFNQIKKIFLERKQLVILDGDNEFEGVYPYQSFVVKHSKEEDFKKNIIFDNMKSVKFFGI